MKYIKKFEELNIIDLFTGKNSLEKRNQIIEKIFTDLTMDGYEFKIVRKPGKSRSRDTGVIIESNDFVCILKKLDGATPIFNDLLSGNLEFVCNKDLFKLRPFIKNGNKYSLSNLREDFPNVEFDPNDPDVVEKIKNFIDQFEIKVLTRFMGKE